MTRGASCYPRLFFCSDAAGTSLGGASACSPPSRRRRKRPAPAPVSPIPTPGGRAFKRRPRARAGKLYGGGLGSAATADFAAGGGALVAAGAHRRGPGDASGRAGWRIKTRSTARRVSFRMAARAAVTFGFGPCRWGELSAGTFHVTAFIVPDTPCVSCSLARAATLLYCVFLHRLAAGERTRLPRPFMTGCLLDARKTRAAACKVMGMRDSAVPPRSLRRNGRALLRRTPALSAAASPALAGAFRLEKEVMLGTADVPHCFDIARAREAGKDKRRGGRARGAKKYSAAMPESVRRSRRGARMPRSAAACWAEEASTRAAARSASGISRDRINLLPVDAAGARAHPACCAHQYAEGDVQHWYHPTGGETDKGVRTDCADDLLAPWAVCEYVRATADDSLCAETAPYLSPPLTRARAGTKRRRSPARPARCSTTATAPRRSCSGAVSESTVSLRMGGGDWNDGFDAMGESARRSVWLTWFASGVFPRFFRSAHETWRIGRGSLARPPRSARRRTRRGTPITICAGIMPTAPLGASGAACRIDSVAQSLPPFSPHADRDRVQMALTAALAGLRGRRRDGLSASTLRRSCRRSARRVCFDLRAGLSGKRRAVHPRGGGSRWRCIAPGGGRKRPRSRRTWRSRSPRRSTAREPFVLPADIAYAPGKERGARGGAGIRARQGGISDCLR